MITRDPSVALQDAVFTSTYDLAGGKVFYDVPADTALPYIYFGDDDIIADYDNGGDFFEATANVEAFAADKIALKEIVAQIVARLDVALFLVGFAVLEWRFGSVHYRQMEDGLTQQASLEFTYLIAPDS